MKKLLVCFIKDRLLFTIIYFVSCGIIIIYFYLSAGIVDVVYPLLLCSFIFSGALITEWIKYYRFYSNLERASEEDFYELQPENCEQKLVSDVIIKLHGKFTEEISKINMENTNKAHFLSQWIHNMKTPVSVIGLILQKAKEDKLLEDRIISDLEEENSRLHNGLEQVLNMFRMEEFFRDYEPEAVNLVQSLTEVINGKKSQFIYSNVFPKFQVEMKLAMVITDNKWNKFMLDQIISNAIKYSQSEAERKYITFSIKKQDNYTQLEIQDQGVGIPKYDLERVFEPFFTGENGRRFKNSTGIGLYISSKIAEKLGHNINIDSAVNEGTKVTITYVTKV